MGIRDRDYMKRPPDKGGESGRNRGRQAPGGNSWLGGFLGDNRRFLIFVGGAIAVLFILKILVNLLSE